MNKTSRHKKVSLRALLFLIGLIGAVLIAEAALRIVSPSWLVQRMNELNLTRSAKAFGSDAGWSVRAIDGKFVSFKPHTDFKVKYYEYNTSAHIDGWGGRIVQNRDSKKREAKQLVPFLGDSFTFGIGVEDSQTYVSLLNLNADLHYLNLGVPGSALPNHLDMIEFRHRELFRPPLYVFSFFTGNDYSDIIRYYTTGAKKNIDRDSSWFLDRLDRWVYHNQVLGRSYVLQFIKQELLVTQSQEEAPPTDCQSWFRTGPVRRRMNSSTYLLMSGNAIYLKEAKKYTDMAVRRLVKLSRELHFRAAFIILPDKHQADADFFQKQAIYYGLKIQDLDTELPGKIIEQELRNFGIPYYDVLWCLKSKKGLYYKIDDHFRPVGHRAVSRCLSVELNHLIESEMNHDRK